VADPRRFEDDTAARQRTTGAPSKCQFLVRVGDTAFVSAFVIGLVDLQVVLHFVLIFTVMIVMTVFGSAVIRRANIHQNRYLTRIRPLFARLAA
jgi:hypothetical protein